MPWTLTPWSSSCAPAHTPSLDLLSRPTPPLRSKGALPRPPSCWVSRAPSPSRPAPQLHVPLGLRFVPTAHLTRAFVVPPPRARFSSQASCTPSMFPVPPQGPENAVQPCGLGHTATASRLHLCRTSVLRKRPFHCPS